MLSLEEIGARIRTAREDAGFTQVSLAAALDTKSYNVSKWEAGKHPISLPDLLKLAELVGVQVGWIVGTGVSPQSDAEIPRAHYSCSSDGAVTFTGVGDRSDTGPWVIEMGDDVPRLNWKRGDTLVCVPADDEQATDGQMVLVSHTRTGEIELREVRVSARGAVELLSLDRRGSPISLSREYNEIVGRLRARYESF